MAKKTNLYLLSIVGIVAVVGVIVLVLNVGKAPTYVSEEETLVGEAIDTTPSKIMTIMTVGKPDLVVNGFTPEYDGSEFRVSFDVVNNGKKKISAGKSFDVYVNVDFFGIGDYGTTSCIESTYSDETVVTIELDSDLGIGETVFGTALLTTDPRLVKKLEKGEILDGFWINTIIAADYDEAGGTGNIGESDETNNEYEDDMAVTT